MSLICANVLCKEANWYWFMSDKGTQAYVDGFMKWTAEEAGALLYSIVADNRITCAEYGTASDGYIYYIKGANIAYLSESGKCHGGAGYINI